MEYGIWNMGDRIWDRGYGISKMADGRSDMGYWRWDTGDGILEMGYWRWVLVVGGVVKRGLGWWNRVWLWGEEAW